MSLYKKYKLLNGCDQKTSIEYKQVMVWLSVFLSAILILMDYEVFTDVFHFSQASFLSIYFYNLNPLNSEFFIFFAIIPILLFITVFLIPYFSVDIPMQYMKSIEKVYNKEKVKVKEKVNISGILLFSLFYTTSLFIISSGIFHLIVKYCKCEEPILFVMIMASVFISLLLLYFFISYFFKNLFVDIQIGSLDILSSLIIVALSYIFFMHITKLYNHYHLIVFSEMMVSFLFIEFSFQKKLNMLNKIDKKFFISMLLVLFMVLIIFNKNFDIWKKVNDLSPEILKEREVEFTFNLLLNKTFLSTNKNNILVDSGNYGDICNGENISLKANETTVLPLSKTVKLYFKRKDKNYACVYAIEKKYFHGKPVYNLLDMGYIDNNKTKH